MESILKVEHLEKYYGNRGNVTKAVDDISFTVTQGEYIGIMGASGSGKTTLLNCISTIDSATAGHIFIRGQDVTQLKAKELSRFRREQLGFIFQEFNLLDTLTAFENIALALTVIGTPAKEIDGRVHNVAKRLEIDSILGKYPYQLSGGEQQRVAAARDLVQDILLEVNIGREEAKSGFAPEKVLPAAEAALERTHVRVRGLMTIPPADAQRDANFRYFQEVQALYVDMNQKLFHNELEYLSMGMSGDYEDAIRAGATMVRVGSAIFGARHYN